MREPGESVTPQPDELPHLCRYTTGDSPLPIIAVEGPAHIVRYANPAFCLLASKEAQELVGHPFAEAVPEEAQNCCTTLLDRVYRTGQAQTLSNQEHASSLAPPVFWSYTAWVIREESKPPRGVIVQVTDTTEAALAHQHQITARQHLQEINQQLLIAGIREQELAERALEAEQKLLQLHKMESIGRLAGGIAHDFNNLLTAILGFTELAIESLLPEDEVQNYLLNIHQTAERAAALTSQLLAFASKQVIAPRVVELNSLVLDVNAMLSRLIGDNVKLQLVTALDAGNVKIDPGQFGQVLVNLIVNARDAMPDGGTITIATSHVALHENEAEAHLTSEFMPGHYTLLTVSDTGTGIPDDIQSHLFEPFFTTKAQGKGTGLGLATCYGIVKQNGGHIEVSSEAGQGATFSIYLPCVEEAVLPAENRERPRQPRGTESILLVEDEPLVRDIGVRSLRHQGYTVLEAANGVEALNLLHDHTGAIDLLITDVMMPQMGGKELAERFRAIHPHVPVLFTSGYAEDTIVHQGALDPGLEFLQKPFTLAALALKVREILDEI